MMNNQTEKTATSGMSVGAKISLGFAIVLALHVSIAVMSHFGLEKVELDREKIRSIRGQVETFNEIDRLVSELQRNVTLFAHDGFAGPEERAFELLNELSESMEEAIECSESEEEQLPLIKMKHHLKNYRNIFTDVIHDRAKCNLLLTDDISKAEERVIEELDELASNNPDDLTAHLAKSEFAMAALSVKNFIIGPDSSHIRSTIQHLKKLEKIIAANKQGLEGFSESTEESLKEITKHYQNRILQLVQATRGYLHLTNVVLAGEEQEFLRLARNHRKEHTLIAQKIAKAMNSDSDRFRMASYWFSFVTIVLGILAAWLINRDIGPRLNAIASTFDRLTAGETCGTIPGVERKDELGRLASAAQVFKEKAAVTERLLEESKQSQNELNQLNSKLADQTAIAEQMASEAKAATDSKSEFLANMSHEIRTPMTAILGFTTILAETEDKAIHTDAINTIRRNGEHLLCIINDILDLSKVEVGKMNVELSPECPIELLNDIILLMQVKADSTQVELQMSCQTALPQTLAIDPARFRQILINLVGNAIKFTEQGKVELIASYNKIDDHGEFIVDVIDTGIGIDQPHQEKLFQPFVQADNSMRRGFGGTGLGLTISKRLAQMLGGDVELVASQIGKGSHFRLTLASYVMDPKHTNTELNDSLTRPSYSQPLVNSDLSGCHVLLAEDGIDNQRYLRFLLEKAGVVLDIADNGKLALESYSQAIEAGWPYDCIIMDMQMPEMDGYQATSLLRGHGFEGPIIALTANAMNDDRQKCVLAGCDEYLTKPISPVLLLETIKNHLQKKSYGVGLAGLRDS